MIPNKRSVGRVVQLQFWKGCALCHFLGFDKNGIFPYVRALQPKGVPSFLLMDIRTFAGSFMIWTPNTGIIKANPNVLQRHWTMRFGKFDSPTTHCFWRCKPSFKAFALLQAPTMCYISTLKWYWTAKCTNNSIVSKFGVISFIKKSRRKPTYRQKRG